MDVGVHTEEQCSTEAQKYFAGRVRVSYGWGTGLTNDLVDNVMVGDKWFGPMSPDHATGLLRAGARYFPQHGPAMR